MDKYFIVCGIVDHSMGGLDGRDEINAVVEDDPTCDGASDSERGGVRSLRDDDVDVRLGVYVWYICLKLKEQGGRRRVWSKSPYS